MKKSVKHRDSKGRILRNGESQRKDGCYVYKYIDLNGKAKFVYLWSLEIIIRRNVAFYGISWYRKEFQISFLLLPVPPAQKKSETLYIMAPEPSLMEY